MISEIPKIKIVHLLLNPQFSFDVPREMWESRIRKQEDSIKCWRGIAQNFSHYVESYSLLNRSELPSENCAQPEIVNRSLDFNNVPPVLSYGHYGAYTAHKRAILQEFSSDLDALLIVEGDVQFKIDSEEMSRKIFDAARFCKEKNGSILTFGNVKYGSGSRASISDTSIDFGGYKQIDHFLCAHCYLIMQSERKSIQEKLKNTGWHAWDIWLYWNYDRRVPIFSTKKPLVWEPEGASLIDYRNKED